LFQALGADNEARVLADALTDLKKMGKAIMKEIAETCGAVARARARELQGKEQLATAELIIAGLRKEIVLFEKEVGAAWLPTKLAQIEQAEEEHMTMDRALDAAIELTALEGFVEDVDDA